MTDIADIIRHSWQEDRPGCLFIGILSAILLLGIGALTWNIIKSWIGA